MKKYKLTVVIKETFEKYVDVVVCAEDINEAYLLAKDKVNEELLQGKVCSQDYDTHDTEIYIA